MVYAIKPREDEFQSHAGSIEAHHLAKRVEHRLPFQSHAGSIEATPITDPVRQFVQSFNPTLVRLRRATPTPTPALVARFQSHAGSIEANS